MTANLVNNTYHRNYKFTLVSSAGHLLSTHCANNASANIIFFMTWILKIKNFNDNQKLRLLPFCNTINSDTACTAVRLMPPTTMHMVATD